LKLSYDDVRKILDGAHNSIKNQGAVCYVSGVAVNGPSGLRTSFNEANVAVIDATLGFLQSQGLLKEPISIDYRQKIAESIDDE
jgi:uncharacterized protein YbaA (DUF1428 family)